MLALRKLFLLSDNGYSQDQISNKSRPKLQISAKASSNASFVGVDYRA